MPLQVTFTGTQIADYLRIDPTQEAGTIDMLKDSAIDEAEQFLNTDFSIDGVPKEAPAMVKEWILNRIAQKFENRGQPVKPDYSTLSKYRVPMFRAATNNNVVATDTPETDIINGAD
jgi:hypothetical protein